MLQLGDTRFPSLKILLGGQFLMLTRQEFRKFAGFLLISTASQRHNIYQCIKTMIPSVLEGSLIHRLLR
jgi:hypothetical protein